MGQYWRPVNLTKKEFIDPYKLGAGLKLWEQLANTPGVGAALIVLLAVMPERRGGGDLAADPIIGHWAGDKVVFVGDYSEDGDFKSTPKFSTIYGLCYPEDDEGKPRKGAFKDITDDVVRVIERELEGRFVGDGWREWKTKEELPDHIAKKLVGTT